LPISTFTFAKYLARAPRDLCRLCLRSERAGDRYPTKSRNKFASPHVRRNAPKEDRIGSNDCFDSTKAAWPLLHEKLADVSYPSHSPGLEPLQERG
jgi:hypothetical protein